MNSRSILPMHDEFTILRIHYFFCENTMNIPSLREFITNSQIHFTFMIFSRIYVEFTICFAYFLSIHYLFREFTTDPLSLSRVYYKFTICFSNLLWIYYFSANWLWIHYLVREFNFEFIIFFANSLWIQYLFRDFTMNSLSVSRIQYEFTICRELILNTLSFSQIYIFFPNLL